MGREQDWKEIEKSQMNYEQNLKDQYKGVDIIKLSKENRKTVHKVKKINAQADKIVKALLISYVIFLILLTIFGTYIYVAYLNNLKNRVDIDFITDLKECYGVNAKIVSEDIDKYANGKYVVKSKEKIMQLTKDYLPDLSAETTAKQISDDYLHGSGDGRWHAGNGI